MAAPEHSIKLLRRRFAKSHELRVFSTQGGFAQLVGRSEGYIRSVEKGVVPLSSKLAEVIEEKTGVAAKWLLQPLSAGAILPVSRPDGTPWEPAAAIQIIKAEIDTNKQALTQVIAEATRRGTPVADLVSEWVKNAVEVDLEKGSLDLLTAIANLLRDNGHLRVGPRPGGKP